jgi:hypothetical protein
MFPSLGETSAGSTKHTVSIGPSQEVLICDVFEEEKS